MARCGRVVLALSYNGNVCQVCRGVRVWLWAPCMVAKCNRCVISLCDGVQAASSVSYVVWEWYAGEVCQANGCTWRLLLNDVAEKRHCDYETWFYGDGHLIIWWNGKMVIQWLCGNYWVLRLHGHRIIWGNGKMVTLRHRLSFTATRSTNDLFKLKYGDIVMGQLRDTVT